MKLKIRIVVGFTILACALTNINAIDLTNVPESEWIQLFNGVDIDDWVPAVSGYESGQDPFNYFYVEDSILWVDYSEYTGSGMMGTLGNMSREFSYFMVRAVYQFWGEQAAGGPDWAKQNNGILFHSQSMESVGVNDNYPPICMETQLLGEENNQNNDGTTANLCTIGATVVIDGVRANYWCQKATPRDIMGLEWVTVEVLVLADSVVKHIVMGDTVMTYTDMIYKHNGEPMQQGYIAIQAESAPTMFRKIEILDLVGCMDENSPSYRDYFFKHDASLCEAPVSGCTDPAYLEYNPEANVNVDDSCITIKVEGCMDPAYAEYNSEANVEPEGACVTGIIGVPHASEGIVFHALRFSINHPGPHKVKVTDTRGQTLFTGSGEGYQEYNLANLEKPGICFITTHTNSGSMSRKVVLLER
jgi:hypothetical protein